MSVIQSPRSGLVAALCLSIIAGVGVVPVAAADSPEGTVNELIDMVVSGDLSAIDEVVCGAQRDAALQQFDLGTALDVPVEAASTLGGITFSVDDRAVELVSQEVDTAIVHMSATVGVDIDEGQMRELVRALLQVDGESVADEDIDLVLPLMVSAFDQEEQIDEELTLILEGGTWLICGGLGAGPVEDPGLGSTVSFDGICGLAPLSDINAVGPPELQYDSSFGGEDYCSYTSTSSEDYYSATLTLARDGSLDDYREVYPDGSETVVAGVPAYVQADELFVGLADGVLQISLIPPESPPAGFDAAAYLTRMAELFAPLIPELEPGEDAGSGSTDFGAADERSLCEAVSAAQIAALSPLPFDDAFGSTDFCTYSSSGLDASSHFVTTSLEELDLDDFRSFFPDGQDLTVAGLPAYAQAEQLWVQLDGSLGTFGVGAFIEGSPGADGVDALGLARQIAELAVPNILVEG